MSLRELDALIERALRDPSLTPRTRALVERVFDEADTTPEAVTEFCARAIVMAREAVYDVRMRHTLAWLGQLAALVHAVPPGAARPAQKRSPARREEPAREEASAAYFSPGTDCLDAIRREFDRARERADVCVFTVTDDRIRDAMLRAHRRGVALRVITDNDKAFDEGSDVAALQRAGVALRIDQTEHHMHHKFAVFDGARLLNGSYNWTRSAANFNEENVIVTADPALVGAFTAEFERLWARFAP